MRRFIRQLRSGKRGIRQTRAERADHPLSTVSVARWRGVSSQVAAIVGAISAIAVGASGCGHQQRPANPAATQPSPVVVERQQELTFEHPHQMRAVRPVKAGSPPLVYMLETPADVRVVDATTGATLGEIDASAQTIVSLESTAGVRVGGHQLKQGPLAEDHVYEIYATPIGGGQNVYRTEQRTAPALPAQPQR